MATDLPPTDQHARVKRSGSKVAIAVACGLFIVSAIAMNAAYVKTKAAKTLVLAESAVSITDTIDVNSGVGGKIGQMLVKPGDQVTQGQLIAIVESPQLLIDYRKAQQDLVDAQKQDSANQPAILPPPITGNLALPPPPDLSKLKPLPSAQGSSTPSVAPEAAPSPSVSPAQLAKIDNLKAALAKDQLAETKAGDAARIAQSEFEEAQSAYQTNLLPIDSLKSAVELAKTKRDKFQGLYNDGIISRSEFQAKQGDLDSAQSSLDQANQNAASAGDNAKAKQSAVDATAKALISAQASISKDQSLLAKEDNSSRVASTSNSTPLPPILKTPVVKAPKFSMSKILGHHKGKLFVPKFVPAPASLAPVRVAFSPDKQVTAETKVQKAQRIITELEAKIKACRIVASADGTVSKVDIGPGADVAQNARVITLIKPTSQRIVATFAHDRALRIKYGQVCDIRFTEFPHRVFAGQVARFIDAGNGVTPAKVEILLPTTERDTILAMVRPDSGITVQVHTG